MLGRLRSRLARRRDPERLREDAETRQRAAQELREAEQRKSEERRGFEGYAERPPR
jgi:hypothetical protein